MLRSPRLVHREIRLAAPGHSVGRDPDLPGLRSRGYSRRDLCRGVDGEGSRGYSSKRYLARAGELGSSNRHHGSHRTTARTETEDGRFPGSFERHGLSSGAIFNGQSRRPPAGGCGFEIERD